MKNLLLAFLGIIVGLGIIFPAGGYLEKGLIFEPSSAIPSSHASTIVQLPDGDMLCAWYSGKSEGARDVAVWASRFERGGGSWSVPYVLADTPNKPEGNPVLFVSPQGKVYLYYATIEGTGWASCSLKYIVSEDSGRSFGPVEYFRKQWGWLGRNHIIVLSTGEFLFPLYSEIFWRSEFMLSRDGGKTWERAGEIKSQPGNIQPAVVELDDGSLLALMRTGGKGGKIWQSYSRDKGKSWSEAKETSLPNPNAGIDLIRLKSKELVLAFNNSGQKRTPLSIALSQDDGKTWTVIKDIETEDAEFSYPSLCQDQEGKIWLTYTWKRRTIGYARFDLEWLLKK